MTRRYGLRDDQWERIKDLLPGQPGKAGANAKDNRLFVEAVLYRYRAGIPWRDLPERFGDFRVVHTRFSRWNRRGVWQQVFEVLGTEPDNEYAMVDSMIVRVYQPDQQPNQQPSQKGTDRKGKTGKQTVSVAESAD